MRLDYSLSLHVIKEIIFVVNKWNSHWGARNQCLCCLEHADLWLPVPYAQRCKCCFHSHISFVPLNEDLFFFNLQGKKLPWAALLYPKVTVTLPDTRKYSSTDLAEEKRFSPGTPEEVFCFFSIANLQGMTIYVQTAWFLYWRDSRKARRTKVLFCPVFILKSILQLQIHMLGFFHCRLIIEEKSRINTFESLGRNEVLFPT